jgi:hypothetical protein
MDGIEPTCQNTCQVRIDHGSQEQTPKDQGGALLAVYAIAQSLTTSSATLLLLAAPTEDPVVCAEAIGVRLLPDTPYSGSMRRG